jgi:hypothetical protein
MSVIIKPATHAAPAIVAALSGDVAEKIVLAVNAQLSTDGKWLTAADSLYAKGVRWTHLQDAAKGGDKDIIAKVDSIIVTAFSERVQNLLAATSLIGMLQDDRDIRKAYVAKTGQLRGTLRKHLKAHEANERGAAERVSLSESIVKVLQGQIDRIKTANEEKIDFDAVEVMAILRTAIAELS